MAFTMGLTESDPIAKLTGRAESAISDYRILTGGVTTGYLKAAGASSEVPIAVSLQAKDVLLQASYAAEDVVTAVYGGIAFVEMSGSGNQDNSVVATTGGLGTKVTYGSSGQWGIGFAMKDWVDGEIIPVMIDRHYIGDTDASS
mgnify:CR=1 FL=1